MSFFKNIWQAVTERRFLVKTALLTLGFILFVVLMDVLVMPVYTKHGKEFELPDVTEKQLSEAVEILSGNGFKALIQDSVYDSHYPAGTVIRQNPLPFATVKKGRRVYLVVSIGEKPIYMPNLIGKTPQDAEFKLREEKLELNRIIYEFSEFYPRGVVINQSVPPGIQVKRNQKINLTVSLGPQPSAQEIPNLKGKSLENARKILESIGVPLRRVRYQVRPNLVPGTVLSQSVSPGTSVQDVKFIDLVVSTDKPLPESEGNSNE